MEQNMDIKTNRLSLVPVDKEHVQDIFANFNEQVTKYMLPAPASNISETYWVVGQFVNQKQEGTDYVYAITLKSGGEFIGLVGLHYLKTEMPHLRIWIKLAAHGYNYGREAIGGVIEYAKSLGITKLCYPVDRRNIASKKIPLFYSWKLVSAFECLETQDGRTLQTERYEIEIV